LAIKAFPPSSWAIDGDLRRICWIAGWKKKANSQN